MNTMAVLDRKARKKLRRRQDILDAAYAIFREVGYSSATMDSIAERADLAKGTVYIYFKSKEELYFSLLVNGLDIIIDILRDVGIRACAPEDMLKETARSLVGFFRAYTDYFRLFMVMQQEDMQSKLTPDLTRDLNKRGAVILQLLGDRIRTLIEKGYYGDADPRYAATILWGAFIGIAQLAVTREYLRVDSGNMEDLVQLCFDLLDKGLAASRAAPQPSTARRQRRDLASQEKKSLRLQTHSKA